MLEYNQAERLLIEGIKKHSWYNMAVPTHQEVVEEFKTIINEINAICTHPNAGLNYGHIRKGYYASKVKAHLIFYRIKSNKIEIIRILHERMDVIAQFTKP
jgi:plasmid stabilization system protein ParE